MGRTNIETVERERERERERANNLETSSRTLSISLIKKIENIIKINNNKSVEYTGYINIQGVEV